MCYCVDLGGLPFDDCGTAPGVDGLEDGVCD